MWVTTEPLYCVLETCMIVYQLYFNKKENYSTGTGQEKGKEGGRVGEESMYFLIKIKF